MGKTNDFMKKLFPFILLFLILFVCTTCEKGVGVLTIKGIPRNYDGNYVLSIDEDRHYILGVDEIVSIDDWTFILPKISNGEVKTPLWNWNKNEPNTRYLGNDTCNDFIIVIYENSLYERSNEHNYIKIIELTGIQFKNGNATINWADGRDDE